MKTVKYNVFTRENGKLNIETKTIKVENYNPFTVKDFIARQENVSYQQIVINEVRFNK